LLGQNPAFTVFLMAAGSILPSPHLWLPPGKATGLGEHGAKSLINHRNLYVITKALRPPIFQRMEINSHSKMEKIPTTSLSWQSWKL
jgi:hypothetical protein